MKSIKETSKEWCNKHSNKGCTEQCDGCWQVKSAFGCEQHNMELAYEAGANYVLEQIEGHINRLEYGLNANCMVTAKNACECLRSIMEQLKK